MFARIKDGVDMAGANVLVDMSDEVSADGFPPALKDRPGSRAPSSTHVHQRSYPIPP